jgi:uncharacterized protein (TIGR03437 family)
MIWVAGYHLLPGQTTFLRKDVLFGGPCGVALGDFNGDERPDMAVGTATWPGSGTPDGLFVLLNEGGGNFAKPFVVDAGPSCEIAAADLNGDGKMDLLTADSGILLGRGDGTFLPARRIGLATSTTIGDFNGDGKPDVALSNFEGRSGATINIYLNNGDGTFQDAVALPGRALGRPGVGDLNRDGKADLVVPTGAGLPTDAVSIFLSKGDGAFGDPLQTPADGLVELADFNGDDLLDLVTSYDILLGKGDGSFRAPLRYVSRELVERAGYPFPRAVADFNGDGHLDVAVSWAIEMSGAGWAFVSIFQGNGDGSMKPSVEHTVGDFPAGVATADLDGDGRPDLAVASWTFNTVSLLLGRVAGDMKLPRAVSAANGIAPVAPGSLATLYAAFPVTGSAHATSSPWPTSLGGISLEVRDSSGKVALAPLLYSSATQVNFQVPEVSSVGEATLAIVTAAGSTPVGSMQIERVAPALFLLSHFNRLAAAVAVAIEPDASQTPVSLFDCDFPSESTCSPLSLFLDDDRPVYLSLFATGFRGATSSNVEVSVNGIQLPVQYAGPQETPGVDQINVRVLPEFKALGGTSLGILVVTIDGVATNRVFLR